MNNLTYVIVDASELANVNFDSVKQSSADKLRYSLDGTKFLLKFEGETPSFLEGKDQYNQTEILNILSGSDWTDPDLDI